MSLSVALRLPHLHKGICGAGLDALQTTLAVTVVDANEARRNLAIVFAIGLPGKSVVWTDDVAKAAVDALLQIQGRQKALAGGR